MSDPAHKSRHRSEALARRDALSPQQRSQASAAIAARIADLAGTLPPGAIAGYWPIRSEADPRPALELLRSLGHPIALPVVTPTRLVFRLWAPADTLVFAPMGLSEPGEAAPLVEPKTLLVPLAAFDRRCHRIGYGRGHYDRTFALLGPVRTIGIAFAVQEIGDIPDEPHDHPLDFVVTEREVVDRRDHRG
ncbi:MAG: 5-formyltetrahydrofolate cyclo-ligase [Hyphomicrobiales bacterium]|nr:5-formyltetrahydrofolate cyclo-ligase [Hyphomicrobiales bacterium]